MTTVSVKQWPDCLMTSALWHLALINFVHWRTRHEISLCCRGRCLECSQVLLKTPAILSKIKEYTLSGFSSAYYR